MEDEIREYFNYKWLLCAIFMDHNYIEENCDEDYEFEYLFFHENNLIYITEILQGSLGYQCFDEYRLNNIASAMKYFIEKYKNQEDKKDKIDYCMNILKLTKKPKGKSIKYFYKDQYATRYQTSRKWITEEVRRDIDRQNIVDMKYLHYLWHLDVSEKMPINDIQFIKSVNMFIKECPEIIYEESMYQYITYIVQKNKEGMMYIEDEEFRRLNDSLVDYFDHIAKNSEELGTQILQQTIFSLIFNQNINETLLELKKASNKNDFFGQPQFDILCEYIMNNKKTCMFDMKIRDNMREVLHTFIAENHDLKMKYSLNELKINLNLFEDEDFKQKNIEFYKRIGKQYGQKIMSQYDEEDITYFKNMINVYISITNHYVLTIVDTDRNYTCEAEDSFAAYYINFIMNNYPLIRENPMYMQRIEDLLYANSLWLSIHNNSDLQYENNKVQKKVKKLYK